MMIALNFVYWRDFMKRPLIVIAPIILTFCLGVYGQPAQAPKINPGVGDTPEVALPLAHLSPALRKKDIARAMRKVGDWELQRSRQYFDQDWTFAALYAGFMATSKSLPDSKYEKAMLAMGEKFQWKLGPRLAHADDQAIGQTYLELYAADRNPRMIAPQRMTPQNPCGGGAMLSSWPLQSGPRSQKQLAKSLTSTTWTTNGGSLPIFFTIRRSISTPVTLLFSISTKPTGKRSSGRAATDGSWPASPVYWMPCRKITYLAQNI